jgi:hypothetical protein
VEGQNKMTIINENVSGAEQWLGYQDSVFHDRFILQNFQSGSAVHPASYSMRTRVSSLQIKRPKR